MEKIEKLEQEWQANSAIRATPDSSRPLKEQFRAFERTLIDNANDRLGSKRKAARALGVDIGTIVRKTQGQKSV
jgi:transcriptional regulator with PAS, ATPase and Fis domain